MTAPWHPDPLPGEAELVTAPVPFALNGTPAGDGILAAIAARYAPVNWAEAWDSQPESVDWLVGGFLETGTVNALFARPGTGKSLVTLETALALARQGRTIVYLDDENRVRDTVERLKAFGTSRAELGLLQRHLVMYSFAGLPALDTAGGGQHLEALAVTAGASLVVLDTTTRMVAGRENDSDTFLALYRCALVPLKARGMTVLRLDHPGKDAERGQRGSSAKDGDVDTIWSLTTVTEGTEYRLERTKSRSGHGPAEYGLRRRHEPLRHEWNCPQNDLENKIIGQLDLLNVAQNAGRPAARATLAAAGIECSNALLERAIKLRKARPGQPGQPSADANASRAGESPPQDSELPGMPPDVAAPGSSRAVRAGRDSADRCPRPPHVGRGSGQSPARRTP